MLSSSKRIMEVPGLRVKPQLWRLTIVSDIDDEFNEGAVSFKDLVSGDWNSAVCANCKCQSAHYDHDHMMRARCKHAFSHEGYSRQTSLRCQLPTLSEMLVLDAAATVYLHSYVGLGLDDSAVSKIAKLPLCHACHWRKQSYVQAS
jgi:hypothetical protein